MKEMRNNKSTINYYKKTKYYLQFCYTKQTFVKIFAYFYSKMLT